jgi:hypothetical protein
MNIEKYKNLSFINLCLMVLGFVGMIAHFFPGIFGKTQHAHTTSTFADPPDGAINILPHTEYEHKLHSCYECGLKAK